MLIAVPDFHQLVVSTTAELVPGYQKKRLAKTLSHRTNFRGIENLLAGTNPPYVVLSTTAELLPGCHQLVVSTTAEPVAGCNQLVVSTTAE